MKWEFVRTEGYGKLLNSELVQNSNSLIRLVALLWPGGVEELYSQLLRHVNSLFKDVRKIKSEIKE